MTHAMTETTTPLPVAAPCEHCGSTDIFIEREDLSAYQARCNDCGSRGPIVEEGRYYDNEEAGQRDAIAAWNRRAAPSPAPAAPSAAQADAEGQAEVWEAALDQIASQLPNLPDEPQVEDIVLAVSRMASELYALKEGRAAETPTVHITNAFRQVIREMVEVATSGDDGDPCPEWLASNRSMVDRWQCAIRDAFAPLDPYDMAAARASATAAPEVVEKGVWVPLEPTDEMMSSGETAYGNEYIAYEGAIPADVVCHSVYRAMISAALRSAGEEANG